MRNCRDSRIAAWWRQRLAQPTRARTLSRLVRARGWAWNAAEADVVNNSWNGGAPSYAITNTITDATTNGRFGKGTVIVFSAGNNANDPNAAVSYPANLSNVIAVGAIDRTGTVAYYSNGGPELDVVAFAGNYAGDIVTMDLLGPAGYNGGPDGNNDYTSHFSGTSAAAPQVAGVAALLLSREPSLTYQQVLSRIKGGADPWGPSDDYGAGKLNAYRTLAPGGGGGGGEEPPPPGDCADPKVLIC